jgi:hypothetical protein
MQAQMPGLGSPIGRPGSSKNIGDLKRSPQRLSRLTLSLRP